MCGRLLPMLGSPALKCEKTLSDARGCALMLANASRDTYADGVMRGRSVPPSERGLRKLRGCHPLDGSSALAFFM